MFVLRFFLFSSLVLTGVVDAATNTDVDSIEAVAAGRRGSSADEARAPSVVSFLEARGPIFSSIIDSLACKERFALLATTREFLAPMRSVLLRELSDRDWLVREQAVEALVGVVEKGDEGVIKVAGVVEKGDEGVIKAVSERLTDAHLGVRLGALRALAQLANKGDAKVIAALLGRLTDEEEDQGVHMAALKALLQVAEKGDKKVTAAFLHHIAATAAFLHHLLLRRSLEQADPFLGPVARLPEGRTVSDIVGMNALIALPEVAEKGDTGVIAALSKYLTEAKNVPRCRFWRETLLRTLAQVAEKGDKKVITAFLDRLKDEVPGVRLRIAALKALPGVAEKGDTGVIAAILHHLADEVSNVRIAALQALPGVAEKGDTEVIAVVSRYLTDRDAVCPVFLARGGSSRSRSVWREREAALLALAQVAERGNKKVMATLLDHSLRRSSCGGVGAAAQEALEHVKIVASSH